MTLGKLSFAILPSVLTALSMPASADPIDLSQLCGTGDCVISTDTTIGSTSGPLTVAGNLTVNPGVVLAYLVDVHLKVEGSLTVLGIMGAPGNGGNGGNGGSSGQPGGAGEDAPPVVNGIFDVKGNITLGTGSAATAEGGSGGVGGDGGSEQAGGAGGAGGAAGSLIFNTCQSFTSGAGAQIQVSGGRGGHGGAGQSAGAAGTGGAGGTVTINARGAIITDASITAVGGSGGGTADGYITLNSAKTISGSGTLNSGVNPPMISQNLSSNSNLSFCGSVPPPPNPIPTLPGWTASLMGLMLMLSWVWYTRRGRV